MDRTHVVALSLWCVASMAVLILATMDWNGVTDRRVTHLWGTPCGITCKCAAALPAFAQKAETTCATDSFCFVGIALAFWKDALLSLKGNSAGSSDGVYDLVFSNKTILDPVILLLCFASHA